MAKHFRPVSQLMRRLNQLSWKVKILLLAAIAMVVASGFVAVSEQPGFCNSCHIMNDHYDSWKASSHSEVNCLDCHLQPGFVGHVKGKINGLAQAVDCIVGRVGTKPNARVLDISCLRSECHNTEELISDQIDYKGIKFTHEHHIAKTVDGIEISCGTCHSHFEGDEHFSVNTDVCFTCHFLKGDEDGERLVQTDCQSCHEVPDKTIERGSVIINHAEFVSYEASCEDSCHKKELEQKSEVSESVCLNCHSFRKEHLAESVELHAVHTGSEKVECFACHGKVSHGATGVLSVLAMMDCQNCHSDTHRAQRIIYATQHPMQGQATWRVLSPMFLTHVECTGCHIEQVEKKPGALDSLGKVAKAVPRACDKCHEPGTGQKYIPFWQGKIKKLHGQVKDKLDALLDRLAGEADDNSVREVKTKLARARTLVDSVEADGSWGVHNLKYTESILLEANGIVNEAMERGW
ncbi:MAG: NapC/NirT family cytochrome c [Phycisphaerales bacterium]|nr:MAG: NapC/NirT family cytochrome c [Phycisphaerales bacterium]